MMESLSDILSKCLPCASPTSPSRSASIFHRNHQVSPENDTILVDGRNIAVRTTDSKGRRLSNEILNGEINLHFVNDNEEDSDENQVIVECPTVSNFPLDGVIGSNHGNGTNHHGSSPPGTRSPDLDIEHFETRKKRSHSVIDESASYNHNSYLTTIFMETDKRKHLRVVHLSPIQMDEDEDLGDEEDQHDTIFGSDEDTECESQDQVDEARMRRNFRNAQAARNNAANLSRKLGTNNSSSSDDEDEYWFSKWARRPRLKKYLEEKKNAENKEASAVVSSVAATPEDKLPEFQLQTGSELTKTDSQLPVNGFLNNKNNRNASSQGVRFSKNQNNDDDYNLYAKNNVSLTLPLPSASENMSTTADNENMQHLDNPNQSQQNEISVDNNLSSSTIKANFNLSRSTENGFTNYAFQPDSDQLSHYYEDETSFTIDNEIRNETGAAEGDATPKANFSLGDFEENSNFKLKTQIETETTSNAKDSQEPHAQTSQIASPTFESSANIVSTYNTTLANYHKQIVNVRENSEDFEVSIDQVDFNLDVNVQLTPSPSPTPSVQEKPLLFFIHGISGSHETWKSQMDYFHALGYEIVAMDLLGHGLSGTPSQAKLYHFESLVQDVITVFDHFVQDEQRQAVIIGHGYGACLATVLTRVRPKSVCILISISGGGPTPMVSSYWCDSPWFPFPCSVFPRTKKKGRFDNPDLKNILPRNVHENILHGQIWLDGDPAFHRRITVPTLLIYGMRDKVVNLVEVCEMERTIPRAFLELIPSAGHMVMWDEPEKLNRMIRKFIQAQWS